MHSVNQSATLGIWRLTLLVAGNIVGSGIFLLPSSLAQYGSISLLSWGFTALGALMLALLFGKLSAVLPQEGGFYAYCREAFGDFVGFQVAYNYWTSLWVGNAALVVALTGYLSFFIPALAQNPLLALGVNIGVIWLLTLLNCINVRYMSALQMSMTVVKLLPLVLVIVLGLYYINLDHFMVFNLSDQSPWTAFNSAATMTLWSFLGLESASLSAGQSRNPQRDIPRATVLGVLLAAGLYIASYIAIIGLIPFGQLMHSTAPYVDAIKPFLGNGASVWVAGFAAFSCFATLTGWVLIQGQIPLAAARDRLFPAVFLKENEQKVPVPGLVISSVLITILLCLQANQSLVSQFTFIILLATLASLVPYFFTAMAALVLLMKHSDRFGHGVPVYSATVLAILSGLYAFWAIAGAGQSVVFYGCLFLLSSMPVYVGVQWSTRKLDHLSK